MTSSKKSLSRREWLRQLFKPTGKPMLARPSISLPNDGEKAPVVAIIQGRFCLPYRGSLCSTCYEHCPVPDAIRVEAGIPQTVPDQCTGCGICREVCPAPTNAIMMLPRRTRLRHPIQPLK